MVEGKFLQTMTRAWNYLVPNLYGELALNCIILLQTVTSLNKITPQTADIKNIQDNPKNQSPCLFVIQFKLIIIRKAFKSPNNRHRFLFYKQLGQSEHQTKVFISDLNLNIL